MNSFRTHQCAYVIKAVWLLTPEALLELRSPGLVLWGGSSDFERRLPSEKVREKKNYDFTKTIVFTRQNNVFHWKSLIPLCFHRFSMKKHSFALWKQGFYKKTRFFFVAELSLTLNAFAYLWQGWEACVGGWRNHALVGWLACWLGDRLVEGSLWDMVMTIIWAFHIFLIR